MKPESSYPGKSAYSGAVAANYERDRVAEPVWQREQAWMERWAADLRPGERILDIPAGTGRFVEMFLARGASLTAVDVSEDMLMELRNRWPADGVRLIVEKGDAEALTYPADSFDHVVCWRLFHLLPPETAERVLRELARVCRGTLVIEVFGVQTGGAFRVAVNAARAGVRKWLRGGTARAEGNKPWSHIANFGHSELALRRLFDRAGLSEVRAETLDDYAGAPARVYFLKRRGGPV